jgi:hypothetical protein
MSLTPLLEPSAPMESVNGDWSTIGSAARARRLWSWSGTLRDRFIFCPNRVPRTTSARYSSPQPPPGGHRKLLGARSNHIAPRFTISTSPSAKESANSPTAQKPERGSLNCEFRLPGLWARRVSGDFIGEGIRANNRVCACLLSVPSTPFRHAAFWSPASSRRSPSRSIHCVQAE